MGSKGKRSTVPELSPAAMAALHDVAVAAGADSDPDRLARLVVDRARSIVGGDGSVLRWYEQATNSFRLLAAVGTGEDVEALIAANAPTAISGAFKTGQPVVMNDYRSSGQTTRWGRLHNISAQVAVPLLVDGRPVGTLAVLSYADHRFDAGDALFLSLTAAIVAPALESARLASEVKRQARSVAQIYEALPVMVIVYGRDGRVMQYNSAAESAMGEDRLFGGREGMISLVREDGTPFPTDERPFERALRSKAPVRGTVVGYGTATRLWAYIDAVPLLDEDGEVEAVVTSSIDITRLKAAEEKERQDAERLRKVTTALRESEQLFSSAFEASGVAMAMTDMNGIVLRVNPAYCHLFGFAGDEVIGRDGRSLMVVDDVEPTVTTLTQLTSAPDSTVITVNLRAIHRDGHGIWTRVTTSMIRREGVPPYVLAHVVDISEERKAESILRSERERLGEIIEAQQDIVAADADLEGMLKALAERMVRLVGGGGVAVLLPEGDELVVRATAGVDDGMPELRAGLRIPIDSSLAGACFRSGHTQRSVDVRHDPRAHGPTAREGQIGAAISTPLVSNGEVVGVVQLMSRRTNAFDETDARTLEMVAAFTAAAFDRARTTRRIKASEQRTRAVMESAPDPIVVFDAAGDIVDFNPAAEHAFLRGSEEVIGQPASMLLPPRHREGFLRWTLGGREANSAEYAGRLFESSGLRSDGTEFPIEIAVTDLAEEARLVACFIRDLTMRDRLKESRERLAAVVSSAHVILLATDTKGVITLAQGSGLTSLDVAPEQMVGKDIAAVLEGRPEAVEYLARALAGDVITGLIHLVEPERYLEGVLSPIRDGQDAVSGLSVILTDVTERMLQAARQASLLAALSDVGEGLVTTQDGRFVSSNDAYLEITGFTRSELAALPSLYDMVPPEERAELERALGSRMAAGGPVIHVDSALLTKDGRRREIEASIVRVTEDGAQRLVTLVRDVTDQRRAEEAERDSEAKSRLMAMMNHEVRTPLNSILGFASLLNDPRVGDLNEKQRRYVSNIKAAGDHLLQLANDSLDMAKLDAGRAGIVLAVVAVDSVVGQAVEQVRPMAAADLNLTAEPAPDLRVQADARHLTQVLLNLLSNAIRHTHSGTVKVAARRDGESVAISVSDTGDGISREDLARIFEEFFQGGNHAPGGIGLGLSISKRLVHLMGGSIAVESELGRGSVFTVRLAAAK